MKRGKSSAIEKFPSIAYGIQLILELSLPYRTYRCSKSEKKTRSHDKLNAFFYRPALVSSSMTNFFFCFLRFILATHSRSIVITAKRFRYVKFAKAVCCVFGILIKFCPKKRQIQRAITKLHFIFLIWFYLIKSKHWTSKYQLTTERTSERKNA